MNLIYELNNNNNNIEKKYIYKNKISLTKK